MKITVEVPYVITIAERYAKYEADGVQFFVTKAEGVRDRRNAQGWDLVVWFDGGLCGNQIKAHEGGLFTPGIENPCLEILHTFASFLEAWRESVEYGGDRSENRDLFPISWERALEFSEEFYMATMGDDQ